MLFNHAFYKENHYTDRHHQEGLNESSKERKYCNTEEFFS